jgi:hypothetical protein
MIIAIIMGRKGSKGFPEKNLYVVLGKPLAYYPMKAAKDCTDIDKVYLSTDDERLMKLATENGLEIIKRPAELCTDNALGEHVYVHAYKTVKEGLRTEGEKRTEGKGLRYGEIELIVLLMCNAPTVTSRIISEGIKVLREHPEYDSAVTVSKYNMWSPLRARKIGNDGLLHPFVPFETFGDPKTLNCDRDSQGDVWFADMGVSIIRPKCLENLEDGSLPQKWMGQEIYPLKQWGGLDIDYEWQIPQVEYWLKIHG